MTTDGDPTAPTDEHAETLRELPWFARIIATLLSAAFVVLVLALVVLAGRWAYVGWLWAWHAAERHMP